MEARVAKLEALAESTDRRIGLLETDVRGLRTDMDTKFHWAWNITVGGFVLVLSALAGGFIWLNDKIDGRFNEMLDKL